MDRYKEKSSVNEIQARFDADVERFSNLETGQQTTLDAQISLELITDSILSLHPNMQNLLDIGCGAGNYTLKLLQKKAPLCCTLLDLSQPMLNRAKQRIEAQSPESQCTFIQADLRTLELPEATFDCIMAGAVLHHLRENADWESVFRKLYKLLKPGGSIWISDYICHDRLEIQSLIYRKYYGDYLENLEDAAYRDKVFAYIEQEDTPRSLNYQLDLLKKVGFQEVEVLHKHFCFATFGAIKSNT